MANACNHLKVKDIPKNADGTWLRICHHCFKAGHLRSKCPDLGRKPAAAGGSYYVEVCRLDLGVGWGSTNLPEEDLLTRSYDLVVGTFNVFWDLFQVLVSGFISRIGGVGGSSQGWFFEYVLVAFFFINFS